MTSLFKRLLILGVFSMGIQAAWATDFDLGKNGTLSIETAADWNVKSRLTGETSYELTLEAPGSPATKAIFSIFVLPVPRPIDPGLIDGELTQICARFVDGSVEKKPKLQPYQLKAGYGVYSTFTDESLVGQPAQPGDFKVMAPGMMQPNPTLLAAVTLFTDNARAPRFIALRQAVESVTITPYQP